LNFAKFNPKIISLFAGCGGLDLPFHEEGYEVVWANDYNEWAVKTYKRNISEKITCGDINDYDPYDNKVIPDADIIIGGFPCQDFSIIWKRPGLKSERGNLYKNFLRFIDAKKPKIFVAENVKGLLSANKKKAIKQIIKDFEDVSSGYMLKIRNHSPSVSLN
jgi:DNA (cytosine-5)-methyltransferase 1